MSPEQIQTLVVGALQGLGASTIFILVLFLGFCTLLGFPKLRPGGRHKRVIRSLDEIEGGPSVFLPASAPRGHMDQLKGPELYPPVPRKAEG